MLNGQNTHEKGTCQIGVKQGTNHRVLNKDVDDKDQEIYHGKELNGFFPSSGLSNDVVNVKEI